MATYTRFSPDDVVITTEKVFTSTWTNNTNILETTYTSSTDNPSNGSNFSSPSSSGHYYINVYNASAGGVGSEVQYSISYGHKAGSGSAQFGTDADIIGYNASRAVYSQYRSLVYGDETRDFTFGSTTPDDIIVINVNRARYKQSLRIGSLNLKFSDGNATNLTDDSVTNSGSAVITNAGRQYNIVTGSNGVAQDTTTTYGFLYPDAGLIILNGTALNDNLDTISLTRTPAPALTVSNASTVLGEINSFELDSQENISSQFYFVRAKNKEFNYTTNPSFIDANGNLNFTSMVDNPVSYITTVGLYNDANELLAVAKLSQPITKDFTKEALIKVKLDY